MNDDLHAFLRSRRSIRHFKPDHVPGEIVQRILETAICAPSAHNLQPWRFVVLTSNETKLDLAEAIAGKFQQDMTTDGFPEADIQARVGQTIRRAGEAPVIVILCRDRTMIKPQPDAVRERAEALMGVQSVALAGLQLLLAAHAEGLGGTWICWPLFAPDETRRALGLASNWEPQGMVFLGYPAETPEMPIRISLQEVTRYL
ncbi:MAG: nitroreductase family protein [Anaerolineales bacterium]|jgi:F420 biosynthesis protein FbiB-like protein